MTRKRWAPAAAAILIAATCGVVAMSGAEDPTAAAQASAADTAKVELGELSAMVSQGGTLTYRARSDGSPYVVINQARGVYTELPDNGDRVGCGGVLYRVDDRPVVLLCGTIPVYRALHVGMKGRDVRQLNRNLHQLGYDAEARGHINPDDNAFTSETEQALRVLQRKKGVGATGGLGSADAVFLPEAVRIAKVTAQVGGPARPGAPGLSATSATLHVQVNVDPSQQGEVKKGDRAQITLPGNTPVAGRVAGFGRVAQTPEGQGSTAADATVPTFISLDDPAKAGGLDQAPVQVDITTKGVDNALSVPVTALVGKSGGGFAVEVVRAGGRRELVAVRLGLFDTGGGRVQVEGPLNRNDLVVVPSL
ncbi:MAG TPA: efflux RND transporter periplasmic adaptor subunit [Baekduia sp.]|nr:efflux RND transporter periplasmic adaptor subunit [Baekduia sp.]